METISKLLPDGTSVIVTIGCDGVVEVKGTTKLKMFVPCGVQEGNVCFFPGNPQSEAEVSVEVSRVYGGVGMEISLQDRKGFLFPRHELYQLLLEPHDGGGSVSAVANHERGTTKKIIL